MPSDFKTRKRIRDPEAIRRFRLEHLGEPCEACDQRPGISAHHRIFRGRGGDDIESNLIWLCGSCHDREHGIRSVWYP